MATAPAALETRPDRPTVVAFAAVVLIGGTNFVAVSFSNRDLPPLYGAGLRFAIASLLFAVVIRWRGVPLPRGRSLVGTLVFGSLFTIANALAYWALLSLPAGIGGVIFAAVPLLTLFLAVLHRLEPFRWRGAAGAVVTVAGIIVLLNAPLTVDVRVASALGMLAAAVCAAEAGVVIKLYPPAHPAATNGTAMAVGAALLLGLSQVVDEPWSVPDVVTTWLAVLHLAVLGGVALLALYFFVLQRWTASGASYQFVLMPIVTVLLAAWLAGEPLNASVIGGGLIVLAGVYVGALSHGRRPRPTTTEQEAVTQRCATP
ncbi:MAG TPA: EamA family transporter [Nitriliruptorales bacterium]|nr:EamA family transporter [Nitriliruptorales bacterium]